MKFTAVLPPTTFDVIRKGVSESPGGDYKLELVRSNDSAKAHCYAAVLTNPGATSMQ